MIGSVFGWRSFPEISFVILKVPSLAYGRNFPMTLSPWHLNSCLKLDSVTQEIIFLGLASVTHSVPLRSSLKILASDHVKTQICHCPSTAKSLSMYFIAFRIKVILLLSAGGDSLPRWFFSAIPDCHSQPWRKGWSVLFPCYILDHKGNHWAPLIATLRGLMKER